VFDVVRQLAILLPKQAILATVARATADQRARGGIHR
jgi:hypothetical protein